MEGTMLHNRLAAAASVAISSPHPVSRSGIRRSSAARKCGYLLLGGLSLGLGAVTASAEELSHNEMVCALDPQCVMPVVNRRLRGVSATSSVRTPGSFDRIIHFAFNSAELTPQARRELDQVAAVLADPHVEKYPIIIHGHTDDVGSMEYNQSLSQRRAEAARQYFVTQHGIDPNRLIARGHGKSQLLVPSDPTSELNRRVQFENAKYTTASIEPAASQPSVVPGPAPSPAPQPSVVPSPAPTQSTPAPGSDDGDGL
jgi:outer membrane protein OmpA-like peptidoglycan-associated protein